VYLRLICAFDPLPGPKPDDHNAVLPTCRREMQGSLDRLVLMAALGGISTASILAAINSGAQAADNGKPGLWSAMLFIIALLLFIKTQNYVLLTATSEIEGIIHKVRVRLMDHIRQSELLPLDAIGRAEIVGAITRETAVLTQASNSLGFAAQGAVLIIFVALYVAYLSLLAFALSVVIVGVAALLFHSRGRQLAKASQEASQWENRLYNRVMDLLDGFKEVPSTVREVKTCTAISSKYREPRQTSRFAHKLRPSSEWSCCRARCTPCWGPSYSPSRSSAIRSRGPRSARQ